MRYFAIALGLLIYMVSSAGAATKASAPVFADLDGDGKKEKISLVAKRDRKHFPNYVLRINKAELPVDAGDGDELTIVDINRADKYKEINIEVFSDSDISTHYIYWYDGEIIREIGNLFGHPTYLGNGIILDASWNGFVSSTEKYVLNKKRTLDLVPQEIYYVGKVGKVNKSFPIFYSRTRKDVVANLEVNSKITVLGYAPNLSSSKEPDHSEQMQDWILIKTQHGLLGWATLGTVSRYVEGMQGAG